MNKTYEMLLSLVTTETDKMTLEDIAREYRGNLSPSLLATAYKKVYRLIICTGNKYIGLTEDDIASYSLEKLDYCLLTYNEDMGKFSTYFTTVIKNKFREETQSLNTHKRKAIFHSASYEQLIEEGFDIVDESTEEENLLDSLKTCNLTDRELLYCKYLVQAVPNKEIAQLLGVSQMTLSNMRKKLREKLMPLTLNIA